MTALAAVLVALAPSAAPGAAEALVGPETAGGGRSCGHTHGREAAVGGVRANLRHHRPDVNRRRVRHFIRCAATPLAERKARKARERGWEWRHSYAHKWPIVLNRQGAGWKGWARSTAWCEGKLNPSIHNSTGLYHGTFQFLLSTWWAAGGTGDPHQHSYAYQTVIAIGLARREGAGHWPVCG